MLWPQAMTRNGASNISNAMSEKTSYGQILKSSSIMGGAAGVNLLLGMVRTKFAAVLIGSAGVGLLASFAAIQGLIGTLSGLGIHSSAVREVAEAFSRNDEQAIGRTVLALRRVCWLTGVTGMLLMMAFSPFISQLTFGSDSYTADIAALGFVILLANVSGGQLALIQGARRIGDMARANIIGAALGTFSAIGFYAWLGLRGVVPSLLFIGASQLLISWYFARQIPLPSVVLTWRQSFIQAGKMVRLGLVFMWNSLLLSAVSYFTITLISKYDSVQAVGIYSAAYSLSGMFVNFVLQAMAADYYPRLTGMAHNKSAMNRLVNEQTEVGLFLATPGLMATLVLAPWIVQLLYTSEFLSSVDLLHWFVLGCFGRVVSWPLGFLMLALGNGKLYLITETSGNILHIALIAFGLSAMGIEGVAVAFPVLYFFYTITVVAVGHRLTGFHWRNSTIRVLGVYISALLVTFAGVRMMSIWPATIIGIVLTTAISISSLRGLVQRIGTDHSFTRTACRVPGFRLICGL